MTNTKNSEHTQQRNALRAAIFDSKNSAPKKELVTFFGQEIELRQPNLKDILHFRNSDESADSKAVGITILYAYVPGTDMRVFEDADKDQLLAMPFGTDYTNLNEAIARLTNLKNLETAAAKN